MMNENFTVQDDSNSDIDRTTIQYLFVLKGSIHSFSELNTIQYSVFVHFQNRILFGVSIRSFSKSNTIQYSVFIHFQNQILFGIWYSFIFHYSLQL